MAEKLCEVYHRDYGLELRIARFHNVFGEPYAKSDPEKGKAAAYLVMKALRYPDIVCSRAWETDEELSLCK